MQLEDITVERFIDMKNKNWDYEVLHDICNDRDI